MARKPSEDQEEARAAAGVPAERPPLPAPSLRKADSDELEEREKWRRTREGSAEWVLHSTGTEMMHNPPARLLIAAINIS